MQSKARTVKQYLDELPGDRRGDIEAVRKIILKNLPKGYEEMMLYGMIAYVVPLKAYPAGYLGNKSMPLSYVALASQKNYMSLYITDTEGDSESETRFKKEYKASGKKLDMGKVCVRFKSADDLPLDVIGRAVARTPVKEWVKYYESSRAK